MIKLVSQLNIKSGGRLPHGECFLALGFELQPVSYSLQSRQRYPTVPAPTPETLMDILSLVSNYIYQTRRSIKGTKRFGRWPSRWHVPPNPGSVRSPLEDLPSPLTLAPNPNLKKPIYTQEAHRTYMYRCGGGHQQPHTLSFSSASSCC